MTDVCDLYDSLAEAYGDEFLDEAGARLLGFSSAVPPARILDLGAGRGAVTIPAVASGLDVVAIDGSPRMIDLLKRDCPGADSKVMRAEHLQLPDESFDVVTAGYLLDLVADLPQVVSEIRRVLRPDGVLAFSEPGRVAARWRWLHDLAAIHFDRPNARTTQSNHERTMDRIRHELEVGAFGSIELVAFHSPIAFDEDAAAWAFLLSNGGIAAACRELEPRPRSAFTEEIRVGLRRMLDVEGCIEVDRDALLLRTVRP